jgi:glutathione S-transferase
MKMAKIDYKVALASFVKAPKGRVPYIKIDDKFMGDSNLIIEFFKKNYGDPLDGTLTDEEKAQGLALQRMVEDHLYVIGAWLRWSDDSSWNYIRDVFKPYMPPVIGKFVLKKIRKEVLKHFSTHGVLEFDRAQVIEFAKSDIFAISKLLGKKNYFFGDKPTSSDALLYGFLAQQIFVPWDSPIKAYVMGFENLVQYCSRMKKQYWTQSLN